MSKQCKCAAAAAWAAGLALLAGGGPAGAAPVSDTGWQFNLMPYLWFPTVSGNISASVPGVIGPGDPTPRTLDVQSRISPNSYLSNLKFAMMLIGEARKGPWLLYTDLMYSDIGGQDARVHTITGPFGYLSAQIGRTVQVDTRALVWTLGAGYALVQQPAWDLDLVAGARYLGLTNDLKITVQDARGTYLRAQNVSATQRNWDAVVGARGRFRIAERWFVPFYADVGGGSSDLTWQGILGLGYRFRWGEATLAWKALYYRFDSSTDLTLSGPGLGVGVRW